MADFRTLSRSRVVTTCIAAACLASIAVPQDPRRRGQTQRPAVNASDHPVLKNFAWRSIGPAVMGGRIDDVEAVESAPHIIYVGLATGGVWKSTNNGTTWRSLFDEQPVCSVGDLAVGRKNTDLVWVGTGEPNNRQSSSYGAGIYKSADGGRNWKLMGLENTHTIARILIDPDDENTVYVAANGHLFGANEERGLYKTTDGGENWQKILYIDENTGITDISMDPSDSKVILAAAYQRRRTAFGMNGGGPGSGLYKSKDGGESWVEIQGNGFPEAVKGRIALAHSRSKPSVVYAQVELMRARRGARGGGQRGGAQRGGAARGGQGRGGRGGQRRAPNPAASGVWRSDDGGDSWKIVSNSNSRPMYFSQIRVDPTNHEVVWVAGQQLSKSTDGGVTFRASRGLGHVDQHGIWIDPKNGDHVLAGNDGGFNMSYDGGRSWDYQNLMPWGQFYAVGVDMQRPYHVFGGLQDNGTWAGPSRTRSSVGILNEDWYKVKGADGFYVAVDPTDDNTVYAESQNGGVSRVDLKTGRSTSIRPRSAGGRGGTGRGAAARGGRGGRGGGRSNVAADSPGAGLRYRWNWNTPIHLSPHNPRTVYVGGNCLFKSVDRGDTWFASADLTKNIDTRELSIMGVKMTENMVARNDGVSNWGTITTIAESPKIADLVWIGTDDGNVQFTRDGGRTWTDVSAKIPNLSKEYVVSRVEPSRFADGTCYVTVDGHLSDDYKPYVYVTKDFGATWTSITNGLPEFGGARVIEEDTKNPSLLFLGTEFGLYATLNGGESWHRFMTGLPTVRVDDILVHPRDNDLIVGTHGRSIYIMDDITALQQLTTEVQKKPVHLFQPRETIVWKSLMTKARGSGRRFAARNPGNGAALAYHLGADVEGEVTLSVVDVQGRTIWTQRESNRAGLHRVNWNLRAGGTRQQRGGQQRGGQQRGGARGGQQRGGQQRSGQRGELQRAAQRRATQRRGGRGGGATPGTYLVKLKVGEQEMTSTLRVLEDIWAHK